LLDCAVDKHLADQVICSSGLNVVLLKLINLPLESIILGELRCFLHLLSLSFSLLGSNLGISSLALAACLEEIGRDALTRCEEDSY